MFVYISRRVKIMDISYLCVGNPRELQSMLGLPILYGCLFSCLCICIGQCLCALLERAQYLTLNYLTPPFNLNYVRILQITQIKAGDKGVPFAQLTTSSVLLWKLPQESMDTGLCGQAALQGKPLTPTVLSRCAQGWFPRLTVGQTAEC